MCGFVAESPPWEHTSQRFALVDAPETPETGSFSEVEDCLGWEIQSAGKVGSTGPGRVPHARAGPAEELGVVKPTFSPCVPDFLLLTECQVLQLSHVSGTVLIGYRLPPSCALGERSSAMSLGKRVRKGRGPQP